jgi:putative NIF3 family GTP cyclohydrolase 1 type 2
MRHHDVLAKTEAGSSVILTDHTNTERPYLPTLAARLRESLGAKVEVKVSKVDADPLNVV